MITADSKRPSRRYPYVPEPGADLAPPPPAEACTEVGHSDTPKARMGQLQPWERELLRAKALFWTVVGLGFMALLLLVSRP